MPFANNDQCISFFPNTWALSFSLIELAGESCLVSDLRRKAFNISLLITIYSVAFYGYL